MSWRLAFHSAKVLYSYVFPCGVKVIRDAIFDGNIQPIRQLIEAQPNLLQQSVDADGNTALGLAIQLTEIEVVKTLLELGSDPNIANAFDGNHPLFILAKLRPQGNPKIVTLAEILLDAGSDPLHEVRYEADNTNRLDPMHTPSFNETPLLCCIRFRNEDLLKKFIEYEIDINTLNNDTGTSPLILAASLGYDDICNLLLDAGADINASDNEGNTPLRLAIQNHGEESNVVQILIEHGADINAVNGDGLTPNTLGKQMETDERSDITEKSSSSSHIYEEPENIIPYLNKRDYVHIFYQ